MKKKDPINAMASPAVKPNIAHDVAATPIEADNKPGSDLLLKRLFFASLIIMLLVICFTGYNVGFHNDELDMNKYGRDNYTYYATGGKDTSCLGIMPGGGVSPIRYYGWSFDMIAVGFNKITGIDNTVGEINSRHVFNNIFGILCIMFAGLLGRRIGGWQLALLVAWLTFFSPSFIGHAYFNTKDIPFAAGYMATIYFIVRFLDQLPAPTWKTSIWLTLWLYFTINMRVGGLLLVFYLLLFTGVYVAANRQLLKHVGANIKGLALKYALVICGSVLLLILTWPFVLMKPAEHLMAAIDIVKKFPVKNSIVFDGEVISSLDLPASYIPKLLLMTAPLLVIVSVALSLVFLALRSRNFDWRVVGLVLFVTVFPVAYGILTHVAAYGGWRHFLFVYPGICIIAGIGLKELIDSAAKPMLKAAILLACIAGIARPVVWSVKNMPYLYCYFNELAGGFKSAYYSYDTDYWMISDKAAVDWLMANEPIAQSEDTVVIATNMGYFLEYYIPMRYPGAKVKVLISGVTSRSTANWRYAVFNTLFVKPSYLENYYPLPSTVHSIDIDGLPVTSILKDTVRLDQVALKTLQSGDFAKADSIFAVYVKTTGYNSPDLGAYMSIAKASVNHNDEAIALANKCLEYHFSAILDYNCYCGLGIAYGNKRDYKASVQALQTADKIMPGQRVAKEILQQVYTAMKRDNVPLSVSDGQ